MEDDSLGNLRKALQSHYSGGGGIGGLQTGDATSFFTGLETRTQPSSYYWDGLKRGGDPAFPRLLFQYTLDGYGYYCEEGTTYKLTPKKAFITIIPSEHHYYIPREAPSWTYFWLILEHPYVVNRMALQKKMVGPVLTIEPENRFVLQAVKLFEHSYRKTFRDNFVTELALFEFLLEYERFAQHLVYEPLSRENLLEETRQFVMSNLKRPVDVTELAALKNMTRSHYSHYFKDTTGMSPARFIQKVRLEEVTRKLVETKFKLEDVARLCGYANANHLCKVFQRELHISPGEFRRQMGLD
jgi:AraC-like DNA-binding protein